MFGRKPLQVRREEPDPRTAVYALSGDLFGSPEGYAFQDEVRKRVSGGGRRVVLEMAGVEKIDSSGVGILVALMWSASNAGAGLVLAALPQRVEKVLSIAMLLQHIDHADSVEAARARLDEMGLE
jgi:anti-sigma B factor antagonist